MYGGLETSWWNRSFRRPQSTALILGDKFETLIADYNSVGWVRFYYLKPSDTCNLYGHIRLSEQDWVHQTAFHTKVYETVCVTQSVVGSTQVLRIPVESVCHLYYKILTTGLQFRVFDADTDRHYTQCKGTSAQACDHPAMSIFIT